MDIISQFDVFLFDGDGVLYREDHGLIGAPEFVNLLIENGKKVFLLTNNSTKTRTQFVKKLNNIGIKIPQEYVLTSAYITAMEVAKENPKAKVYVIGEQGLKECLIEQGLTVANLKDETHDKDPFDFDFDGINYVITGMDRTLHYNKLTRAMRLLENSDVQFIGTNADMTFPSLKGVIPGGGAMISILENLTKRKIDRIMGKPEPLMFQIALEKTDATPEKTIMFGDRIETDILGAKRLGITGCLLLSGISKLDDINNIPKRYAPDILANSLEDLLKEEIKTR